MGLFNGPCIPTSAPFLLSEVASPNARAYLSVCAGTFVSDHNAASVTDGLVSHVPLSRVPLT